MSAHSLTSRSTLFPAFGAGVLARVKAVIKALVNRHSVRALYHFDERMLKDIGLTRQDVDAALDAPVIEDPSAHLRKVAAGRSRSKTIRL